MKANVAFIVMAVVIATCIGVFCLIPCIVNAHCDTMDGPVVMTAKMALEKGDVTPVLKWIKKEDEGAIREAFQKTLNARKTGPEAKELADMYFFETLVRVHRAGEGAPYTGLKPAGTELGLAVTEADKALKSGAVDSLIKLETDAVSAGILERFVFVLEKKKHADESVEAGREYVEAYVTYVHYVERVYDDAKGETSAHGEAEGTKGESQHKH